MKLQALFCMESSLLILWTSAVWGSLSLWNVSKQANKKYDDNMHFMKSTKVDNNKKMKIQKLLWRVESEKK